MKKKIAALVAAGAILLSATPALAWQEGPGNDWWYIDPSYGNYHVSVPLVIELDGDSSSGQTFNIGDTINISVDFHAYAVSCAGTGNGAYTEWLLEVSGPSGPGSVGGNDYDNNNIDCAESDTDTTLTIPYNLTSLGTHTVEMSSYAAVSQYWTDVADDFADASLEFEVVLPLPQNRDQCKDGGWEDFDGLFKNQGDCVSYVQSNENAVGNRKDN